MLFLGIDMGSSSVKLAVIDGETGASLGAVTYPETELTIHSPKEGWAEQDPAVWWDCVKQGCMRLFAQNEVDPAQIKAVGIAYQMHGLVLVDKQQNVLRPAIIWCDSRAAACGEQALEELGKNYCFDYLCNAPGNFTAAKLRWVQEREPEIFSRVHKMLLPGDYIAMKLTGEITTTASGLSEATLWNFNAQHLATELLNYWNIDSAVIPPLVPGIGVQGEINSQAAAELGLTPGIKISYRSGDQPNNAFSLAVLEAGESTATAGTSGVIYAVTDQPVADRQSRINTFLHVTNTPEKNRNGLLVCVNGAGRLNSWLRQILSATGQEVSYALLNDLATNIGIGSEGLLFHPFGNGAERLYQNRTIGAQLRNLDFNRHGLGHMVRAAQEGIVFSLSQGFAMLKSLENKGELSGGWESVRAAKGNMFLSDVFTHAFANTTQAAVEFFDTNGAEGAARGAAVGCGYYAAPVEAFIGLKRVGVVEPDPTLFAQYQDAYQRWATLLPV